MMLCGYELTCVLYTVCNMHYVIDNKTLLFMTTRVEAEPAAKINNFFNMEYGLIKLTLLVL